MPSATRVRPVVESTEVAQSQSEAAYLRIRDRIVRLEMPPGSVVNETRLREDLQLSLIHI